MNLSTTAARRGLYSALIASALGGVAAATIAIPAAHAEPAPAPAPAPCTASGLATTASGVLNAAGGYLATHAGANDVLTAAANKSAADAESSVRSYFLAHPNEFFDLQNIVRPLTDLRSQCGISVSPGQLALLFDELS